MCFGISAGFFGGTELSFHAEKCIIHAKHLVFCRKKAMIIIYDIFYLSEIYICKPKGNYCESRKGYYCESRKGYYFNAVCGKKRSIIYGGNIYEHH